MQNLSSSQDLRNQKLHRSGPPGVPRAGEGLKSALQNAKADGCPINKKTERWNEFEKEHILSVP